MIRITQMKLPITHTEEELKEKIIKTLRCGKLPFTYEIRRQSLDARHKNDKKFVYTIDVCLKEEKKIPRKVYNNNIMLIHEKPYQFPKPGEEVLQHPPVIIGSGPAGIFCAWYLAKAGYRPIVLERGEEASKRRESVDRFWKDGILDPDSNVQFGEGGAGTFSDGKLNTLVKDSFGRNHEVLKRFVEAGAHKEILYQQKPHLGTDVLIGIVETMRHQIEEMGGCFRFRSRVTDLQTENGALKAVVVNGSEVLPAKVCVLAIGHSARDTFSMLYERGVLMEPKSFAVGLRMEHPQTMINEALYGEQENSILGAASYKVTHTCGNGRGVYSFCMCPGGYVVNASTEPGMLAVNGMSYQARAGENANSALIVTVTPEDFPDAGPLGGISFQRELERKAWEAGEGRVPVQTFGDYRLHRATKEFGEIRPNIKGACVPADVRSILPEEIGDSIEEGILAFGQKLKGFDRDDALLSGIESRTSSPVRIVRNSEMLANIGGIYPCGEGAGYAGGITSAAMDGIKIAETISKKYRNF
ncbi:MAG: NAD(P)-binding protein [Eubacteriales bacterium]|nr:NAD(P)-binding protein [Eubacteriales bacterium]